MQCNWRRGGDVHQNTLRRRARRRVTKVREFQQLARLSEADGHLQQRLKQLLKLSKEKWDAACEHAKTAVQARARLCSSALWPKL